MARKKLAYWQKVDNLNRKLLDYRSIVKKCFPDVHKIIMERLKNKKS